MNKLHSLKLEETKKRCSFKTLEKLFSSKLEKRDFKEKLISAQKNTIVNEQFR